MIHKIDIRFFIPLPLVVLLLLLSVRLLISRLELSENVWLEVHFLNGGSAVLVVPGWYQKNLHWL